VVAQRQYGSTRRGLISWILQRLSALYLGIYLPWLMLRLGLGAPMAFTAWRAWLAGDMVRVGLLLFFLALVVHAWIGMRSVMLDYIKPLGIRFTVATLTGLALMVCSAWFVSVLYRAGAVT